MHPQAPVCGLTIAASYALHRWLGAKQVCCRHTAVGGGRVQNVLLDACAGPSICSHRLKINASLVGRPGSFGFPGTELRMMQANEQKVCRLVGLEEKFLMDRYRNGPLRQKHGVVLSDKLLEQERIAKRFFGAMILNDLLQEVVLMIALIFHRDLTSVHWTKLAAHQYVGSPALQ